MAGYQGDLLSPYVVNTIVAIGVGVIAFAVISFAIGGYGAVQSEPIRGLTMVEIRFEPGSDEAARDATLAMLRQRAAAAGLKMSEVEPRGDRDYRLTIRGHANETLFHPGLASLGLHPLAEAERLYRLPCAEHFGVNAPAESLGGGVPLARADYERLSELHPLSPPDCLPAGKAAMLGHPLFVEAFEVPALYLAEAQPAMTRADVETIAGKFGQVGAHLDVVFSASGSERFAALTASMLGRRLALAVNGRVTCSPVVQERIEGGVFPVPIPGEATRATHLAAAWNGPQLPAPVRVIDMLYRD